MGHALHKTGELEVRSWELEVGSWELGVGSWELEVCTSLNRVDRFTHLFHSQI